MNYPNVPDLPGVPPLARDPLAAVTTLSAPIIGKFLESVKPIFGVFDLTGKQILNPDSFVSLHYTNSRKISSYPVEQGSFANYNKVNDPFQGVIKVAKGGSVSDREAFIGELKSLADSLELVKLVTPEAVFLNVNMEKFDYARQQQNGANMIVAECRFVEIRLTGLIVDKATVTTTAKSPSAMDKIKVGMSKPIDAATNVVTKATAFLDKGI